jgi:hypothetical protein
MTDCQRMGPALQPRPRHPTREITLAPSRTNLASVKFNREGSARVPFSFVHMIINLAAVLLHSNSPERWGVPGAASGSFFRLAIVSTLTAAPTRPHTWRGSAKFRAQRRGRRQRGGDEESRRWGRGGRWFDFENRGLIEPCRVTVWKRPFPVLESC